MGQIWFCKHNALIPKNNFFVNFFCSNLTNVTSTAAQNGVMSRNRRHKSFWWRHAPANREWKKKEKENWSLKVIEWSAITLGSIRTCYFDYVNKREATHLFHTLSAVLRRSCCLWWLWKKPNFINDGQNQNMHSSTNIGTTCICSMGSFRRWSREDGMVGMTRI